MQNNPFDGKVPPFTLKNKILLILFIGLGLSLLFFFAFTVFLIAAVVAVVGFLINLFSNTARKAMHRPGQFSPGRSYRPPRKPEDDDVIDI